MNAKPSPLLTFCLCLWSSSSATPSTCTVDTPQYDPCSSSNCEDSEADRDSKIKGREEVASLLHRLKSATLADITV